MLVNGDKSALTAGQIAAHLHTRIWNVTRELQLGITDPRRLQGHKVRGAGVGRSGQWRVDRQIYLSWLQIPVEDRTHLGRDGLPELIPFGRAAQDLDIDLDLFQTWIQQHRWPHIAFGRQRYLTHNQLDRTRVQLKEDLPGGDAR